MTSPRRRTLAVAVFATAAGMLAGTALTAVSGPDTAGAATQALARNARTVTDGSAVRPWTVRDDSTRTPAARVVTDAAPDAGDRTPLRVVTVSGRAGRPQVSVAPARGRQAAVAAVAEAQARADVLAVTVDTRVELVGTDTWRNAQWALDRLEAERVWQRSSGSGAVVAVVDTGVDATHPDLEGRLTTAGVDYVTGTGTGRVDPHSHGTHVAGIVAATKGNSLGVAGLAPTARIMPVRALDADGSGWNSDIARGIIFAADHGADVVNLSLGGPAPDSATEAAVSYAISRGVIVVAAGGNERTEGNPVSYPAAYPGVVAVASTEASDVSSSFSNTGAYIDVAAPGGRILSTVPGGYSYKSGTSMATPYVAAAAALAVSATGGALTPARFEETLAASAEDLGVRGRDNEFGHGLLDPDALLCAVTGCTTPTPTPDPAPDPTPTMPPVVPLPPTTAPPAPAPTPPAVPRTAVQVWFVHGGGYAHPGARRAVVVAARDAYTGKPMAGVRVQVLGWHGRRLVSRTWLRTGANGRARMPVVVRRTTRYTLRVPATDTAAVSGRPAAIQWFATPRVRVVYGPRHAVVRVVDNRRQVVAVQRVAGGSWRTVRRVPVNRFGVARAWALPRGIYRVRVFARAGLAGVTTGSWSTR